MIDPPYPNHNPVPPPTSPDYDQLVKLQQLVRPNDPIISRLDRIITLLEVIAGRSVTR